MSGTPDQKMLACRRFAGRRAPVHWAKQLFDAGQRKHFTYAHILSIFNGNNAANLERHRDGYISTGNLDFIATLIQQTHCLFA